jgi:soluble lytic murein transglycosylase-like protein
MSRIALKCAAALLVAANAFAGEYAILANGFAMHVDRHENAGSMVRLFSNSGTIELPAASVLRFEPEYVAPAPAAAASDASPAADPKALVTDAAKRWDLPPALLHAMAKAESSYNPKAVSPKGAIGVMQLMPETARQLGADPRDPRQNVDAGARYIVELLYRYKDDPYQVRKAIAAYNAGTKAVDRYDGVPPYKETTEYLRRVLKQAHLEPKNPADSGSQP